MPPEARPANEWRGRAGRLLAALTFGVLAASAPRGLAATVDGKVSARVAEARAFEHGEGVPKDPAKALGLYCEAAREFDTEAQYGLGWMYANGRGVARNDAVAGTLFAMAAAGGHPFAARSLSMMGSERGELPDCMRATDPTMVTLTAIPDSALAKLPRFNAIDPFGALPPWKQKIADRVHKLAPRFSVNPQLALAIIAVESNFEPTALSKKGAQGVMQLIPETAELFSVDNAFDVDSNVRGGLAYLRWLLAYYRGQVSLAVAAYNAGHAAVDRYRGIPPYAETREYVLRIQHLYPDAWHPYNARIVDPSPILLGVNARSR